MSNPHNYLLPGLYFVMAPISELGAIPGDLVNIDPTHEIPFVLTRILDRIDGETMLSRPGAVLPVTPSPSPSSSSEARQPRAGRPRRLRLET